MLKMIQSYGQFDLDHSEANFGWDGLYATSCYVREVRACLARSTSQVQFVSARDVRR
ncbi:MAG: hypothetical protein OQK58_06805 [Gammaproteobacteria bacterium]|nr:hypothetical protein [Gammaproteobacteria bacterium]